LPRIRAVLVDLDGTLVEFGIPVREARAEAMNVLESFGLPRTLFSVRDTIVEMLSKARTYLRNRQQENLFPKVWGAVWSAMDRFEMKAVEEARAVGGAVNALKELKALGLKIAIVSSTCRQAVEYALRKLGIEQLVDVVVTRNEVNEVKPSPEPIKVALAILNVKPEEAIVVGDHPYDVEAAKRAGCVAVGVKTGLGRSTNLAYAGADHIIPSIASLPELVQSRFSG